MGCKERMRREEHIAQQYSTQAREKARDRITRFKIEHPWMDVLVRAGKRFEADEMVLHAANFAFSAFLSIFPLILIVASVFGYVFKHDPNVMQTVIANINRALPQLGVVVDTVADSLIQWRGLAATVGVIGLLLSVNRLVFSVRRGFRRIWDMPKPKFFQKYVRGILGSLLMVLIGIVVFVIAYVTSQAVSWMSVEFGGFLAGLFLMLGVFVTIGMFLLIFAILYWLIPEPRSSLRDVSWGGLLAGLLVFISTYLINIYLNWVSKTKAIFGSLGVVVGLLLWLYFTGLMLFLGAEVVRVLQERRRQPEGGQEVPRSYGVSL